jgi:hypothetical protein
MATQTGTQKFTGLGAESFATTHPIAALVEANMDDTRVATRKPNDRHTINADYQVYAGDLVKRHVDTDNANLAYALDLTRWQAGTAVPAGRFLTWYLPWNPGGGQTDMRLSAAPMLDNGGHDVNPSVFFTTQLTGCSVFIRGSETEPQVFHNGTAGAVTWKETSSAHWRNLFAMSKPSTFQKSKFTEVNANQYIGAKFLGQKTNAPHIEAYMADLLRQERALGAVFNVIDYMGTGCVFGTRAATGRWAFYLQENLRIAYNRGGTSYKWGNRVVRLWRIFPTRALIQHNGLAKRLP